MSCSVLSSSFPRSEVELLHYATHHGLVVNQRSLRRQVTEHLWVSIRNTLSSERYTDFRDYLEWCYPNPNTRHALCQWIHRDLRQYLEQREGRIIDKDHPHLLLTDSYRMLSLSDDVKESIQKEQWSKCVDRNKEPRQFQLSTLLTVVQHGWNPHAPWPARALSLMMALGTRVIELVGDSPIETNVDQFQSQWPPSFGLDSSCLIEIRNLAKRKDSMSVRPVLFRSPIQLRDMVHALRIELSSMPPVVETTKGQRSVHPSLLGTFNRYVSTQLPDCTSHDLRRLYGLLSHNVYGGTCNFNIWLSHVLGHRSDNVQASFFYSVFCIDPDTEWTQCRPVSSPSQDGAATTEMDRDQKDSGDLEVPGDPGVPHALGGSFPQVHRRMTKEERWDTLRRAIMKMHDAAIPVTAKKIQVYCKVSTTYAAEALQWYWQWQQSSTSCSSGDPQTI